MLKGLPLAYNKDMQEDKEAVFDSLDTVRSCLEIFAPMISSMKIKSENMYKAAQKGFINATDLADYLTKKGMPFREAYKNVGMIVGKCVKENKVLEEITLEEYKEFSKLFGSDLYSEISLENCVAKRISAGGTGPESVKCQLETVSRFLSQRS
ncbi:MAG: argininosuccinate lyase, partial [Acutalibacteraceae bacterium]